MLIPSRENIEKIFGIYKNECSFHDCFKKIIDSDNHVNGNIIFIKSHKKDHPRYDSRLTNQQITNYTNLIMFCDQHCWEVENDVEQFTAEGLKIKLDNDLKNCSDNNFEFTNKMYREFLHHFIDYHDPERFSYFTIKDDAVYFGELSDNTSMRDIRIKPTKHFVDGKFEIIDTDRQIQEFDKVAFYPKNGSYSDGVQADIEIHSKMRIEGRVPNIPKGLYLVSLYSSLNGKSRLESDLDFTVL